MDMAGNPLTDPASITIPFTQLGGIEHVGDITLRSQAEVNALVLPANVTTIQGNVTIGSSSGMMSDISDLSPLVAITEITGNVVVQLNLVSNLMGLNQLQSIGGDFKVSSNEDLTSLGDFTALQSIGGTFQVSNNAVLTSLGDFSTLQTIGGDFVVGEYDAGNAVLTSLGNFTALQTIEGDFDVHYNDDLISLGDFTALKTIGGWFDVYGNDDLTSLGNFTALQTIGGDFDVYDNDDLTSLGNFSALQTVGDYFDVYDNDDLTSLGDFTALQSIGGVFGVVDNAVLTSLGAFPMLTSIGSSDEIPVSSTGAEEDDVSIVVEGNDLLQDCCVLTTFLSGATNAVSGQVFINDNATGCSSEAEINRCAITAALGITDLPALKLYPNPTSGKLHFSEQVGQFRLYGIEGRLLETRKNVRSVDLSARPAGLYFVEAIQSGRSVRWRVVRE